MQHKSPSSTQLMIDNTSIAPSLPPTLPVTDVAITPVSLCNWGNCTLQNNTKVSRCSEPGCIFTLHALCQTQWEQAHDIDVDCEDNYIGDYCQLHHPKKVKLFDGSGDDDDDDDDPSYNDDKDHDDDDGDAADVDAVASEVVLLAASASTRATNKAKATKASTTKSMKAATDKVAKATKASTTKATKTSTAKANKASKASPTKATKASHAKVTKATKTSSTKATKESNAKVTKAKKAVAPKSSKVNVSEPPNVTVANAVPKEAGMLARALQKVAQIISSPRKEASQASPTEVVATAPPPINVVATVPVAQTNMTDVGSPTEPPPTNVGATVPAVATVAAAQPNIEDVILPTKALVASPRKTASVAAPTKVVATEQTETVEPTTVVASVAAALPNLADGVRLTTVVATAAATQPNLAAGVVVAREQYCDWENSFTGCSNPKLTPIKCQHKGCNLRVHHLCQIEFETSCPEEGDWAIATYCTQHSPAYIEYSNKKNEESLRSDLDDVLFGNHPAANVDDYGDDIEQYTEMVIPVLPPLATAALKKDVNSSDEESCYHGDSDECGSEAEIHDAATEFEKDEETIDDVYGVPGGVGRFMQTRTILGQPAGWFPPGPPTDWKYDQIACVPSPAATDNPGNWNLYSFAPKVKVAPKVTGKKTAEKFIYEGHFTPAGAQVLAANETGVRASTTGWKLYYDGWSADNFDKATFVRDDACLGCLKPESRKGSLDTDVLCLLGLTSTRMISGDALFLFQLLFPINDPESSGIVGDNRMPYFTHASRCTNIYASAQGGGSGVGHEWTNASAPELVKWTAIPIYNGALDGNAGSINARWDKSDGRFNAEISKAMSKTRWRDIKHNFKLNNNYLYTKKKGDDGYDPTSKYDLPYKALIHNMNNVTKRGDMDVTLDESTWGFGGYSGECGGRLINKPVARGMSLFVANCIIFVIY